MTWDHVPDLDAESWTLAFSCFAVKKDMCVCALQMHQVIALEALVMVLKLMLCLLHCNYNAKCGKGLFFNCLATLLFQPKV